MITVSMIVTKYLRFLDGQVAAGASGEHVSNVRNNLLSFCRFVGDAALVADCKQHQLSEWIAANPQWESINTKNNAASAVISCFRWAEDEDLVANNPYRRPRSLKGVAPRTRRPATEQEYLELFRSGSRSLKAALFFLRETGARTCEMREALWDDIVVNDGRPAMVLYQHKTARKTGKCRVIALNTVIAKFLAWLQRRSKTPHIFTNSKRGAWDRFSFATHLRRTAQKIGLDAVTDTNVTAYCLRHTYTCSALTSGATSKEVADQLGHTSTQMVERVYGSATKQNLAYLNRVADDIRRRRA